MTGEVAYEEFAKLDLRIATILEVSDHPNADKLYVVKIDLGGEQRQIVAGIKPAYTKEELVGKQIVVVANLEHAKLRGVESQGMLLAADSEGKAVLLMPEKLVKDGVKIK